MLLTTLQFNQQHDATEVEILLSLQNVVNDKGVQAIDPNTRKCIFPNEQFNSSYKYYSYSTCVTECLKQAQLKVCNCTHHNMIYDSILHNNKISKTTTKLIIFPYIITHMYNYRERFKSRLWL